MKTKSDIKLEIDRIKKQINIVKRMRNNKSEPWLRGYWSALEWVLEK